MQQNMVRQGAEQQVRDYLVAMREAIIEEARALQAEFYSLHDEQKGNEWSSLSLRVRLVGRSLSIEWLSMQPVRDNGTIKKAFGRYIRKGSGFRYSQSKLDKHCASWEQELVKSMEDRFAQLRMAWTHLSSLEDHLTAVVEVNPGRGAQAQEEPSGYNLDQVVGFIPD